MDQKAIKTARAEAVCKYKFKNTDILWEAIQASGNGVERIGSRAVPDGNKRLAVPGDSIIALLLNKESYERGLSRKAMNNKVQKIGGNSNLTIVGKNHHFEVFINPNNAQVEIGDSTFATTVEALVGAADADGGLEAAATVMTALGLL